MTSMIGRVTSFVTYRDFRRLLKECSNYPPLAMFNDFLLLSVVFSFQGALLLTALILTLYITFSFFGDVRVSNLEKKAVFITGCDSGFGYELAKKLDAERLRVFAACLTSEGEAKLKAECSSELITLKLDVTKSRDIQCALQAVKSHLPSQGIS